MAEQRETGEASTVQDSGELGQAAAINHRVNPCSHRTAACQVPWSEVAGKNVAHRCFLSLDGPGDRRVLRRDERRDERLDEARSQQSDKPRR